MVTKRKETLGRNWLKNFFQKLLKKLLINFMKSKITERTYENR